MTTEPLSDRLMTMSKERAAELSKKCDEADAVRHIEPPTIRGTIKIKTSEVRDLLAALEEALRLRGLGIGEQAQRLRVFGHCDLLSSHGDTISLAFSDPVAFDLAYEVLEKLTGDRQMGEQADLWRRHYETCPMIVPMSEIGEAFKKCDVPNDPFPID